MFTSYRPTGNVNRLLEQEAELSMKSISLCFEISARSHETRRRDADLKL